MKDSIRKEKQLMYPIADVWMAISKAEEISVWFIHADFKAEEGYHYTFTHEDTRITGKVLEVSPVTTLIYTWKVNNTGAETTVKWQLEENEEGTLLTLEHDGISKYDDEATADKMFMQFSAGWDNCMHELEKYLKEKVHVEKNK